ncbi:MAG: pyrimidine 5'-nucleotidase [Thermoflexales bacterium]|nr:pyrimidine 5'-nucleotidase [Thermoflexales bacterium]
MKLETRNSKLGTCYQYLLFDLDETLYPRTAGLMQEIARRIVLYLVERMGLATEEANHLRHRFWLQYGTTLAGLLAESQVDAGDYLRFVHDITVDDYIVPNPQLAAMLERISLPKVVFTNADGGHARRVLARLGVSEHFDRIIDIQTTALCNKPHPRAYQLALDVLQVEGGRCIMVEDNARNLRPAKELFGMTTVLVDGAVEDGVDVAIHDLLELEDALRRVSCDKRRTTSDEQRGNHVG